MRRRKAVAGTMVAALAVGALLGADEAQANRSALGAVLRSPAGGYVGHVLFAGVGRTTSVTVVLHKNPYVTPGMFHGLHIHANDDPSNGSGCVADTNQPPATWFMAVDGHLANPGERHGEHAGDLPSPLIAESGRSVLSFTTDRLNRSNLRGRAVVLHSNVDNFGHVPTGTDGDEYKPNSAEATAKTAATGNAGDRVACGVIH